MCLLELFLLAVLRKEFFLYPNLPDEVAMHEPSQGLSDLHEVLRIALPTSLHWTLKKMKC